MNKRVIVVPIIELQHRFTSMKKQFVVFLLFLTFSFSWKKNPIHGTWKIETFIIDSDTVFHQNNFKITSKYVISKFTHRSETEEEANYLTRCFKSTFFGINSVRLET